MGEYANLKGTGERVKIGTCEDMLYLRYDQRNQVWAQHGNVDLVRHVDGIRFRFPWPDEDSVRPGSFDDPFRRLSVDLDAPEGFEHGMVQFVAQREGYNVCLPCPEGSSILNPDGASVLRVHRNGFAGRTFLVQQAIRNGALVGIFQCVCGRAWNAPTLEDAAPAIAGLREQAERQKRPFLATVADRLEDGYGVTP